MKPWTDLLTADALGGVAALLTLATFVCADMRRLRLLAWAANAAFIAYGAIGGLLPIMALHLVLVPVTLWRLHQTLHVAAGPDKATRPEKGLPSGRRDTPGPGAPHNDPREFEATPT